MLRRIRVPHDVPHPGPKASVTAEIHEGLKLVWNNRTLLALAWLAGLWQILHHMQVAVLILFATRELGLVGGRDRPRRTCSAAWAACSRRRWPSGCPRASASARSSCTGSR